MHVAVEKDNEFWIFSFITLTKFVDFVYWHVKQYLLIHTYNCETQDSNFKGNYSIYNLGILILNRNENSKKSNGCL